jgi:hypothetical protein
MLKQRKGGYMQLLKEYLGGDESKAIQTDEAAKVSHDKNAKLWTMVPAQFFAKRKAASKVRMDQKPPIVVIQRNAQGKQKLTVVPEKREMKISLHSSDSSDHSQQP